MANKILKGAFFHHIALRAKNYEASKKFYIDALGMTMKGEWGADGDHGCMLCIGNGGIVELYEGGQEELPADFERRSGCFFHLAIAVDDVDDAYRICLDAGAKAHIAPCDNTIGSVPPMPIRMAFIVGPSGELIELFKDM